MTSGVHSGTNGKTGFRPGPWLVIALASIPVALVNATSVLIEWQRGGFDIHPVEPFFWEFSSLVILVLMAPLVGRAVRRWPIEGPGIWSALAIHAALTVPFALVHIFWIFVVRQGGYALFGGNYDFFGDGILLTTIYEWRKDVISYAIIAATYFVAMKLEKRERQAEQPPSPERIEVRDGGRTLFLAPADILFVEAAGNYVDIHTSSGQHLVRGTLAAWTQKLEPPGFVRIHRSRLVNRAHVGAIEPTGSGDFEVTLTSGAKLQGSRRFRASLA